MNNNQYNLIWEKSSKIDINYSGNDTREVIILAYFITISMLFDI